MKSFKDIVKEVSDNFYNEAKQSPQLIADMAKMEYYMAESYSGRLFVELLQNADDARSTRIISFYNNGNLYFANNGKPFDEQDLNAISRSGASGKQRGKTIGYRGIGFKSASAVSNDIIIYSANTFFTFSKEESSKLLNMKIDEVPTIRIPIFVETVEANISDDIELLKDNGYSTIFVFRNADINIFKEEVKEINDGYFLFLNNVYECKIDIEDIQEKYEINRFPDMSNEHVEISCSDAKREWMVCKNRNAAIALSIKNGCIVPCDDLEAVYHCYLPTLEKSIIKCKINADFSTDPSRKHITLDDKTKESLTKIGELFGDLLSVAFKEADSGKYKNLLNMYLKKTTTSKLNFYLNEVVENVIKGHEWLKLENGETISPVEYKVLPSSFDVENPALIRTVPGEISEVSLPEAIYKNIDDVEEFMGQFSTKKLEMKTISHDLSNPQYVKELNVETHTQLLTSAIRELKVEEILHPESASKVQSYVVKTDDEGYDTLENLVAAGKNIDSVLKEELNERLAGSEIGWVQEQIGSDDLIRTSPQKEEQIIFPEKKHITKEAHNTVHIAKWRDAEVKCVLIEESLGNTAVDVSLKNYGYDVESTTPDGEKRYIEVKSVKKDLAFSMTNNEYTAAHQYGEDYYICLLVEDDDKLEVHYIKNPLENAKFEKRIRQWEWICLECASDLMTFDLE